MKVKKIKFKVKHLLYGAIGVFVIVPNIIIGGAALINKMQMKEFALDGAPKGYYFQGLLNLYVNMPKISPFEDAAYYYMGMNEYNYKNDMVGLSSELSMSAQSSFLAENGVEKAIKYHEKGLEKGANSRYFYKNLAALTSLYYESGEEAKAFEVLSKLKEMKDEEQVAYVNLNEGVLFLKMHKYEEAIDSFNKIDEKYIPSKEKYLGDAYTMAGDFEEGMKYYKNTGYYKSEHMMYTYQQTDLKDKFDIDYVPIGIPETNTKFYENDVETKMKAEKMQNKFYSNIIPSEYRGSVKGKVALENMQGTGIVLSYDQLYVQPWGVGYAKGAQTTFLSYVNKAGEFEFNNVPEGKYRLQIFVPKEKSLDNNLIAGVDNGYVVVEKGKITEVSLTSEYTTMQVAGDAEGDVIEEEGNRLIVSSGNDAKFNNGFGIGSGNGTVTFDGDKFIYDTEKEGDYYLNMYSMANVPTLTDKSMSFYKLFDGGTDKRDKTNSEYYGIIEYLVGVEEQDEKARMKKNKELKENMSITYPDKVWEYIGKNEYNKVLEYYEAEYGTEKKNSFTLQMLVKLYTIGTDELGTNKDVKKALEMAEELYELDKSESGYLQAKSYIYTNFDNI